MRRVVDRVVGPQVRATTLNPALRSARHDASLAEHTGTMIDDAIESVRQMCATNAAIIAVLIPRPVSAGCPMR